MTPEQIAAYVGAAAWLPQIIGWIHRILVQPVVTLVVDQYAEVGFTTLGPILNVKMAFSAENKDVIVDGFELILRHEDGETRVFRWQGLTETLSQITDAAGNRQVISREQPPIALKIGTESLLEKFVRFQEPRYHETDRKVMSELIAHFNYLKRTDFNNYVQKVLDSKELDSVFETRNKSFCWRTGRYDVTFRMNSTKKFKLGRSCYCFNLENIDVIRLRENIEAAKSDLKNVIRSNLTHFERENITWYWANVNLRKIDRSGRAD
jgi:hypothetical protein